jgi:transposase
VVDTSFVKNVWGRDCLGRSPVDRGRKATKVSAVTDARGTPLYLLFHPGNKNDGKTLAHMLAKMDKRIPLRGSSLYGDKAYDTQPCRDIIRQYGLIEHPYARPPSLSPPRPSLSLSRPIREPANSVRFSLTSEALRPLSWASATAIR